MEDLEDDNPEMIEQQLRENEWRRLNEGIENDGFRDGYDHGADEHRQKGFDNGYEQAFDVFGAFGQINGIASVLAFKFKDNDQIKELDGLLTELRTKLEQETDHDPESEEDLKTDRPTSIALSASTISLFCTLKDRLVKFCQDHDLPDLLKAIDDCGAGSAPWTSAV